MLQMNEPTYGRIDPAKMGECGGVGQPVQHLAHSRTRLITGHIKDQSHYLDL
jgi:hypothetical protein